MFIWFVTRLNCTWSWIVFRNLFAIFSKFLRLIGQRIKNETIINTQTDNFFELHITNHGGTGAGPSGSHVVWTGLKALTDYNIGTYSSGMMSVNGVPTFPGFAAGLGLVYTNTAESLANGSGAGAGYLMFEWIGVAEEQAASGYYYDGDAIGEGNL